jgi:putative flippase GtrA
VIVREGLRYLAAGAINTLITNLLYLFFLTLMSYRWAYGLAFFSGVGLSFLLLRYAVFARQGRRFAFPLVAASHAMQFGLGLLVVECWVTWLHGPAAPAPLVAAAVCVPVLFVVQRWVFTRHSAL